MSGFRDSAEGERKFEVRRSDPYSDVGRDGLGLWTLASSKTGCMSKQLH